MARAAHKSLSDSANLLAKPIVIAGSVGQAAKERLQSSVQIKSKYASNGVQCQNLGNRAYSLTFSLGNAKDIAVSLHIHQPTVSRDAST